jgi:long-chain acyl-CoA synthetase
MAMKELVYPRILLQRAEQLPDKVAFIDVSRAGTRYQGTYELHIDRLLRLANAMRSVLGINPGDRFAVLAANSHEYMELYHAAMFGAGIINPLNIRFAPSELAYVLNDSGSRVVFTDASFATLLDRARDDGATVDQVVMIGGDSDSGVAGGPRAVIGYEDLLAVGQPIMPPEPEEGDAAVLMYTGGTTGFPKGALLQQRAEVLNVYHVLCEIGLREERRFLFQSPMFHAALVAGVLGIPASGATSVTIPLFDAELVLRVIEEQEIDTTMVIPIMLSMLEQAEGFSPERLRSLRQLVYGAAPISEALITRWLKMLPDTDFLQGYGMTEAASALTFLGPEDHRRGGSALTSAGRPLFGIDIRIMDEIGTTLPRGEVGEVCARGGNFMREYWKKPVESKEALRDGWYRTGDMGFFDDGNLLHLTDRLKDMIVTGGENVYSTEVENAVASHPAVQEVAVIGIPSDIWGEAVHAIVVLKKDAKATAEELIEHAANSLSGFKVPKSVEFQDGPLPLSGAFKPLKRELRRRYWESRERKVN